LSFSFPAAQAAVPTLTNAAGLAADPTVWRKFVDSFGGFAINLAAAVVILLVTIWASRWASRLAGRAVGRLNRRHPPDPTLQGFASSIAGYAVIIIGLVAVLQQLGVRATSIIAVLGAASLAIGLAMQGTLGNVAAGVMLLLFRHYRVGDFVEIAGKTGTVRALDLFTTELSSPDNLRVVIPNGKVFGDIITNFSRPEKRRMELNFGVDYDDDLDVALALLIECAEADPRILRDPAPWSKVTGLADSSVTVTLRAWAHNKDYWDARFDVIKRIKERFEAEGLSFPYPTQVAISRHASRDDEPHRVRLEQPAPSHSRQ
jgi:small conductance mechanosensitive channel